MARLEDRTDVLTGAGDNGPRIRVTLSFVEMANGQRTGKVLKVPWLGFEKTGFGYAYTEDAEEEQ